MKFGIFDQIDDAGRPLHLLYEQRLELAELYDRGGIYCYHQSEHHGTPLSMAPSQSVFLAAVAQRTKRMKLCPLVYALPAHHPIRLAEEVCMLDHLSNGRFEFGIGRGASPYELDAMGVASQTAAEAYVESFEILKMYFNSGQVDHAGKFWNIKDFRATTLPLQRPHPAMWYASATPDSAAWPARNGVNIVCGGASDQVHLISDRYRAEAALAGDAARPDALIGISRYVVVAETDEEANRIATAAWPKFLECFLQLWRQRGTVPQRMKMMPTYGEMVDLGQAVAGSPETVTRVLAEQVRHGKVNYLVGHLMFGDMAHEDAMNSARLFVGDVMPAITAASKEYA